MRWFVVGLSALLGAVMCVVAAPALAATCPNEEFRSGHGASLPDCRAFELVSPANKSNDVVVNTTRFRMSGDGSPLPRAVIFQSLGGFADPYGSGVAFDYMAQRTLRTGTQGWETHPLNPLETPMAVPTVGQGFDPLFVGEGNPDLTQMVYRTLSPLGLSPALNRIQKLHLRTDLRVAGPGSYVPLLNPSVAVASPPALAGPQVTYMPGASNDLRKILIESVHPLTPDAPVSLAEPKLYKAIDGRIHLVGILEEGDVAPRSVAGQGAGASHHFAWYVQRPLSEDGSRVIFMVPGDGTPEFGQIYMRDDRGTDDTGDDVTVRIDESEREVADDPGTATYWDASTDARRVFFTSRQALTDDAPRGPRLLYMYDASRPPTDDNLTLLSVDDEPADRPGDVYSVIGTADDGKIVYFLQRGQNVAGAEVLGSRLGIYAWRDGAGLKYLGEMVEDISDPRDASTGFGHVVANQVGAFTTPDGARLLLSLREPPFPGGIDHGDCGGAGRPIDGQIGCPQLYLFDGQGDDDAVCVSCDTLAGVPTTPAFFSARFGTGGSQNGTHRNRPMPDDGSRVYFTTGEPLVAADTNGKNDVYMYDVATGDVQILTSGKDDGDSFFLEVSRDGQDVFFATRERLSPWDADENMDIYDARAGGGVPPPVESSDCSGDACQGPLQVAPLAALAPTSTTAAPTERPRIERFKRLNRARRAFKCRRGRVKRRVKKRIRCVTKVRARQLDARRSSKRSHRNATKKRGGGR